MSNKKIAVLNACNPVNVDRESDVYVDYREGVESFFSGPTMVKKCVSWHSIAAAFETEFYVYNKPGWQGVLKYDHVLVMVKDDLEQLRPLIEKLKKMNKIVGIAYHENGNYFSLQSNDLNWLSSLKQLVDTTDYFWNLNVPLEEFFSNIFDVPIFSCWHAFPYEEWNHEFTIPEENREGIFIGTRTFSQQLKRNTLFAIGIADRVAQEHKTFATYLCEDNIDKKFLQRYLLDLGIVNTRVIPGPLPYETWLQLIATHKVLFHMDNADTLGQVVGDAALVGVPSLGSSTVNSRLMGTAFEVGDCYPALSNLMDGDYSEAFASFKKATSFKTLGELHQNILFPMIGLDK